MSYGPLTYTGMPMSPHHGFEHPHGGPFGAPFPHMAGFCQACCHPRSKCCCWRRECRKEAKELLVEPDKTIGELKNADALKQMKTMSAFMAFAERAAPQEQPKAAVQEEVVVQPTGKAGIGKAFIGGGCCVHLSIEYTRANPSDTAPAIVMVVVQDSEQTFLAWGKQIGPNDGYQVKEGIVTTKPGAHLNVVVLNATARVRWCEIFSC